MANEKPVTPQRANAKLATRPINKGKTAGGVEAAELTGHAQETFTKYKNEKAPSVTPATLLTVAIVYIAVVILAHFYATFTRV